MSRCKYQDTEESAPTVASAVSDGTSKHDSGTFEIDKVRSSISIHGHMIMVPQTLSELGDGLSYQFGDEEFDDGLYEVEISDDSGVIQRT